MNKEREVVEKENGTMGIDWEEILGAEGADMADVYNGSIPEESYEFDASEEKEERL